LKRKFKRFVLFSDGASQLRAEEVKEFLGQNLDSIIPVRFPRYSPHTMQLKNPGARLKTKSAQNITQYSNNSKPN
jgi:transposase